jgi:hypothetical protein
VIGVEERKEKVIHIGELEIDLIQTGSLTHDATF